MKRFFLVVLMVIALPVMASHIVGGEFEILHIAGNTYRVNLILYFDILNGDAGARDPSVTARIFRKRDNQLMRDVFLPLTKDTAVSYTQPECSNGEIKTSKITYTTTIQLPDNEYNDPQGYYIVWERCCRNYNTSGLLNIVSIKPPEGVIDFPQAAGQTFYLQFPPVVKNGSPFINSTPRLFPPLNDYACPNKFYYADFAGSDDDGDSLVYSLVTPLNTHTAEALPSSGPRPAPYPQVVWKFPFGINNILQGAPDLDISTDGLLTVTPTIQGLFVFAVRCEEFRKGVKLGEVRRDFQMLVVDKCPEAEAPKIVGRKLGDTDFTYNETMSITFSNTVDDVNRCIEVQVTDPDALKASDNFKEKIRLKAIPLGFKKDVSGILPDITSVTLTSASPSSTFSICFDACPYFEGGPFLVGIVAFDDACSLPLFDTLRVLVNVTPPVNTPARFVTSSITEILNEGSPIKKWLIKAVDEDADQMVMTALPGIGFNLPQAGMVFTSLGQQGDTLYSEMSWDPRCTVFDFSKRTEFDIKLQVEDIDNCDFKHPDFMSMNLTIKLPGSNKPIIFSPELTNSDPTIDSVTLTRKVNESLVFNVHGFDLDKDKIVLSGNGKDFALADYSISFPSAEAYENVSSLFTWNILCDNLNLDSKDEFVFHFIITDSINKCRYLYADTLVVQVNLSPPDNTAPNLSVASLNQSLLLQADNYMEVTLGQQIELGLLGFDKDVLPAADLLRLELVSATGTVEPQGYIFAPAENRGSVPGVFTWNPECNIFENGIYENDYVFTFRVTDDRCFNQKGDTLAVNIKLKDVDGSDTEFLPPNIITPNADNKNDFFAMVKRDETTGELINILPLDNCTGQFKGINIFNRWGRSVFESSSREFKWYVQNEAAGIYYYQLKYSDKEYKGAITVSFYDGESQAQR